MSRFVRKGKPPAGFDYIAPTLNMLENELRDKVAEGHEGKRKTESLWPIHQINWQRSRYVYDMYYKYKKISREVYEYCVRNKLIDAGLVAKWKKPGYERLCSTYVINTKNYKFGTVSICRVPKQSLGADTVVEDPFTGCLGCASGPGGQRNIFGNKYGQYLAAIQVAREEERERREAAKRAGSSAQSSGGGAGKGGAAKPAAGDQDTDEDGAGSDGSEDDEDGPMPAAVDADTPWAVTDAERDMETAETTTNATKAGGRAAEEAAGDASGAKRPRY